MRVRLAAMYGFAVEDCLYRPTCEKRFCRRFGKHRESENVRPTNRASRKLVLNFGLTLKI